ncbi:MAG: hypothetical protein ACR2PA_26910 [Hyphomicrobiaceae bacterium]
MRLPDERSSRAALVAICVLQAVMLAALFSRTSPHPPTAVAVFGIAPFIGASLAVAAAAIIVGPTRSASGKALAVVAIVCALVSFGPHKYLDPQFALIWPAVVAAQISVIVVLLSLFRSNVSAASKAG